MKKLALLVAPLFAATAFSAVASEQLAQAKVPSLMTDAQMKEVVGGVGPGFGICTATYFANGGNGGPGVNSRFDLRENSGGPSNLPGRGNGGSNGKGHPPGFGHWTSHGVDPGCSPTTPPGGGDG